MRHWAQKIRELLCRHMDLSIDFEVDGKAPGWRWHCHSCGKSKDMAK